MRVVDIVNGVGWVIFWVGWFAAAAGAKRGQRGRGNWARFAGVRVILILVVVLLVRLRVLEGHGVGYVRDPVLWGVGLAIWILGLGLAVWARIYLGRNWGMPTSTKEDPRAGYIRPVPDDPAPDIHRHPAGDDRFGDRRQHLVADRRGTDRRILHPQRLRGGAQYDQALPQCLSEVPAVHENADPLYLLRTRGACQPGWAAAFARRRITVNSLTPEPLQAGIVRSRLSSCRSVRWSPSSTLSVRCRGHRLTGASTPCLKEDHAAAAPRWLWVGQRSIRIVSAASWKASAKGLKMLSAP